MSLLVHKYGGTSLATADRIRDVAARIAHARRAGHRLVVVVSAMSGTTDRLLSLAGEICRHPDPRELDMLLTAGERISMSLVAMALKDTGIDSISLTGSQSGIITDDSHTRARILDVRGDRIHSALEEGRVVIVAGFQGVSAAREVTTLGRGGSDVTAVALACRFEAERCEIYTDVDGVYTAHPGRVPTARRIDRVDHVSMVAYARLGAGVLDPRAAELARRDRVPVRVLSSFIPGAGTLVDGTAAGLAEVIGIGCTTGVIRLPVEGVTQDEVKDTLDRSGVRYRAVTVEAEGVAVFIDRAVAEELSQLLEKQGIVAGARTRGTLVATITRPGVDLGDTVDELVPRRVRAHSDSARQPGAVLIMVRPGEADGVVARLHRTLVEETPTRQSTAV